MKPSNVVTSLALMAALAGCKEGQADTTSPESVQIVRTGVHGIVSPSSAPAGVVLAFKAPPAGAPKCDGLYQKYIDGHLADGRYECVVPGLSQPSEPVPVSQPSAPVNQPNEPVHELQPGTCLALSESLGGGPLPTGVETACEGEKALASVQGGPEEDIEIGDGPLDTGRLINAASTPQHQTAFLVGMRERFPSEAACMEKIGPKVAGGLPFVADDVACFIRWKEVCIGGAVSDAGKNACIDQYNGYIQYMRHIADRVRGAVVSR